MKRKLESEEREAPSKKQNIDRSGEPIRSAFRSDLFDDFARASFRKSYGTSTPYPHAVVPALIEETLLRDVSSEIRDNIHFTLKETDIYRIHQSGDLANLSRLDSESLKHLPSLVRLRDALYSFDFRSWVSEVTGAGKVSGRKTDMAVNVYTPGSYLLCHDDVIGSRRVSYILYLTDPDRPWKKEWGGGLRLYPTEERKNKNGETVKVPQAEHSLNIPPSFGQLSFFAVRPGESYHDVEEVYHRQDHEPQEDDGGRIRMAISGWFHIPQEGEDGYEEGLEQAQAQNSSLAQLRGAANEFDEPQPHFRHYDEPRNVMSSDATHQEIDPGDTTDTDDDILTERDLTFLLHYISPSFLVPGMIEKVSTSFTDTSVLQLEQFFKPTFAEELRLYIQKSSSSTLPGPWKTARPPHKHRYRYLQSREVLHQSPTPFYRILTDLLHSHAFKKWLALITGLQTSGLIRQNVLARRFRHGKDYALASTYEGDQPQLEFTIGLTLPPSQTNGAADVPSDKGKIKSNHKAETNHNEEDDEDDLGGEEIYMAAEDDDAHSINLPAIGSRSTPSKPKHDPAVYSSHANEEDDGILFVDQPNFNVFSAVLRDRGTLRFVKYLSRKRAVEGDRWDIKGEVELSEGAFAQGEEERDGEAPGVRDRGQDGDESEDEYEDDLAEEEEENFGDDDDDDDDDDDENEDHDNND